VSYRPIAIHRPGYPSLRSRCSASTGPLTAAGLGGWSSSGRDQVRSARGLERKNAMKTVYVVQTIPVRDAGGAVIGWVRADPLVDGTRPTDTVILRDGAACGQAEAARRIARDPGLLYSSRDEAVRDGLARLRKPDQRSELQAP
jgi:hypothetical protein